MAKNNEFAYGLKGPTEAEVFSRRYDQIVEEDARRQAEREAIEREIAQIDKEIDYLRESEQREQDRRTAIMSSIIQAKATLEAAKALSNSRNNDGGTVTLTNEQFQQLLDAAKSKY